MRNFDKTWIKLPRSFTSWRWYHESKMVHLFLYLLLQANVKKKDYLSLTISSLLCPCPLLKKGYCLGLIDKNDIHLIRGTLSL